MSDELIVKNTKSALVADVSFSIIFQVSLKLK
ncbi:Uncharacterised protein [Rodentibacter pneumotropicus]|uniref:Uncharacterized protein n=1 Tax=Rodentibacter pneumotropicus TaxID=758 RepID=A0A448MTQ7_9PAST|nr:Uncharacterised protein [Rodentibacter pneumotropicus]